MRILHRIEEQVERDVKSLVSIFLGFVILAAFLLWPLALITGDAFGKHPGVLAWVLGSLAELVWFFVICGFFYASQKAKDNQSNSSPQRRR
ncbi:MAG: hypothetical protein JRN15_14565 [Nitrososphaerota archaeon]|nr:hypothetical protein [Nitrososphaerota archaeon]